MLLWESPVSFNPFTDIPKKDLGISTSVKDLPDTKPYGFWVDRHGNFVAVGFQKHAQVSDNIQDKMVEWMKKKNIPTPAEWGYSYNFMFKNGWMRVVTYYDSAIYTETKSERTQGQIKFLNFIRDLYYTPETPIRIR